MTAKTTNRATKTVKTESKVEFVNLLQNAFAARRDACIEKGLTSQATQLKRPVQMMSNALMQKVSEVMTQTDFDNVARIIAQTDKSAANYEQVKTLVKVADMLNAIANSILPRDNNMRITLEAMHKNDNRATVREILTAQSNAIREAGGIGTIRESFKVRSARYSAGTGSSQGSQTRQVLRILNLANVCKGKRDDDAQLTEYGRSIIGRMFA